MTVRFEVQENGRLREVHGDSAYAPSVVPCAVDVIAGIHLGTRVHAGPGRVAIRVLIESP